MAENTLHYLDRLIGHRKNGQPIYLIGGAEDDPKPDDKPDPKDEPEPKPDDKGDPDKLGDPGKRALDAIRKERDTARDELKAAQAKVKAFEDKDKSESEKNAEARAAAEKERDEAKAESLRLSVAFDKGLTPAQAKRLSGATKEELEADADELLDLFGAKPDDTKKPPGKRPKERLRGGGDPDDSDPEETDPAKLADMVPRRY